MEPWQFLLYFFHQLSFDVSTWSFVCNSHLKVCVQVGKEFPHTAFQKQVHLLRTKNRDNVGTASTLGWPPNGSGRVDTFRGLVANFYSLGTKKIPADWLGHYKVLMGVGISPNLGSGSFLAMIKGLLKMVAKGLSHLRGWLGSRLHFCGLSVGPWTCGPGAGLHSMDSCEEKKRCGL